MTIVGQINEHTSARLVRLLSMENNGSPAERQLRVPESALETRLSRHSRSSRLFCRANAVPRHSADGWEFPVSHLLPNNPLLLPLRANESCSRVAKSKVSVCERISGIASIQLCALRVKTLKGEIRDARGDTRGRFSRKTRIVDSCFVLLHSLPAYYAIRHNDDTR